MHIKRFCAYFLKINDSRLVFVLVNLMKINVRLHDEWLKRQIAQQQNITK